MKHKSLLFLTLLFAMVLPSCQLTYYKTEGKEASVYSLFNSEVNTSNKVSYQVISGQELLPYLTFSSYFSLYGDYFRKDCSYKFEENSRESSVMVYDNNNELTFVCAIDNYSKIAYENGDFSSTFTISKDYSKSSLTVGSTSESELVSQPKTIRSFSYKKLGFKSFRKNSQTYYPLSLLECLFSSYSGVFHVFNYSRILQYSDYEELTKTEYEANNQKVTAFKEMKNYIDNNLKTMPMYLREDRRDAFLFTLENQYGIKFTREIPSMIDYLAKTSFYDDFLSESTYTRNEAFYKTFALLDDGHSTIRDDKSFAWYEGEFNQYGTKLQKMLATRSYLSSARKLTPGQIHYSSDKKLAFFTFDTFTFAQNAYQEDGKTFKESLSDYNSEDYDTYFYFIKILNLIKEKGGVQDVVIDLSTNGGGTVGIMTKLITLLNKTNKSDIYLTTDVSGLVQKMTTKVDSNFDGVYDNQDVYGNDFKFYILTSEFSFSCGNAFPFYLKKNGIAKTIGVTSGGGECAVGESYLPSGEHFYHSSNLHIGWYQNDTFEGDEPGVKPDIEIKYTDFFNLDTLQSLINA